MKSDEELRQFIATHWRVFPRHPYTVGSLRQLIARPAWNNPSAWAGTAIAGDIMVFARGEEDGRVGIIEDLFVQRAWRRRGIASYLLDAALTIFEISTSIGSS